MVGFHEKKSTVVKRKEFTSFILQSLCQPFIPESRLAEQALIGGRQKGNSVELKMNIFENNQITT